MNHELLMNPHRLVDSLQKPSSEFTKADIISYIQENDIRMVNFMYPAADGRLKTLNFVINNADYLNAILTCGERVDGSSLFPFIEASSSDLYVIPRFCTALESESNFDTSQKQTVEMRSPDGSADLYQLIAGLAVACRHGFEMENALTVAKKTYVNVNIHQKENADKLKDLAQLPDSCSASADCLQEQRAVFEKFNVFSPAMVDGIISRLRAYNDVALRQELRDKPEGMLELVNKYFHCG